MRAAVHWVANLYCQILQDKIRVDSQGLSHKVVCGKSSSTPLFGNGCII